ncbi:hypothetical protein SRB17_88470 [Streptomyces sp. RB17]|uniref:alkaline shock response membrane anchor protein AmaP n=1 Tax=Streptomyces sp. RB17 TaxID=2585197 RepID=UPI001296A090|nr:alkaline shock response membrane anchor protein AmaP [Streptomyces sp. RB17]MQY40814.1 hypothetical protein [Streptomyces sp. RB17]
MTARSALNRILLAISGLVLLVGGLLVLFAGLDLYRRWNLRPPAGWPLTSPADVLLTARDRTRWSGEDWWWPAVIAALVIVIALALWWLIAQLGRPHPGGLPVGGPHHLQGVELREHALRDALAEDTRHLPDVHKAQARITGTSQHPRSSIGITLTPHGVPGRTLHELSAGPLHNASRSTSADWPTEVRLHVARHKPHRAQ